MRGASRRLSVVVAVVAVFAAGVVVGRGSRRPSPPPGAAETVSIVPAVNCPQAPTVALRVVHAQRHGEAYRRSPYSGDDVWVIRVGDTDYFCVTGPPSP